MEEIGNGSQGEADVFFTAQPFWGADGRKWIRWGMVPIQYEYMLRNGTFDWSDSIVNQQAPLDEVKTMLHFFQVAIEKAERL